MVDQQHRPISLAYSYAHKDEALRDELEKHLSILRRQGMISTWYDRQILPGTNWSQEINAHFQTAELILLLISPDFLTSDYCYGVEMRQALERHERGETKVIPIILRPVDWQGAPFEFLQGLPRDMKPITTWENRDEAFVDIARGVRWTIAHMQGIEEIKQSTVAWHEETTPLAPGLVHVPTLLSQHDLRNRQSFLAALLTLYNGVLADSLQGTALIALGLQSRPDTIMLSARLAFRHLQQAGRMLPPETSIQSVYEQAGGELLILGAPGAGKSTLLLHLAQSLCLRAARDRQQPLPVIFNLSSWVQKHGSLAAWLVEELLVRYGVPRLLGTRWVAHGQILPLLDGLDEVAEGARSVCIDAINAYRRDSHDIIPLVVCSRAEEYLAQQRRLMLRDAVVTQPLSIEQIDHYLADVGSALTGVRDALRHDSTLRELASFPLMLNVLMLAYRDVSSSALPIGVPVKEMKRQIFAHYVERMLSLDEVLTFQQTSMPSRIYAPTLRTHLIWLAQQMQRHNQSTFYLERLQADWLSHARLIHIYRFWALRMPTIFMGILLCFVLNSMFFDLDFPTVALYCLVGGLLGGILSRGSVSNQVVEQQKKQAQGSFWSALLSCLGWGVVIGVAIGLVYGLSGGSAYGILYGVSLGVASILLQTLLRTSVPSTMAQQANGASWQYFLRKTALFNGTLAALIVGLSTGVVGDMFHSYELAGGPVAGLVDGLNTGLKFGPAAGVLSILLIGRPMEILPADQLIYSWKSLKKSLFSRWQRDVTLWSFALIGLGYGIILAIVADLTQVTAKGDTRIGIVYVVSIEVISGLSYALSLGLVYWLLLGLYRGVSSETIEDQRRITPNEGTRSSLRNGLSLGLAGLIIAALLVFLSIVLIAVLNTMVLYGLLSLSSISLSHTLGYYLSINLQAALRTLWRNAVVAAFSVGLLIALLGGGWAYLRHSILRFLLAREGNMPRQIVSFLEEASRHIFLRKVGGGYTFIHREFQDYMASLDPALSTTPRDGASFVTFPLVSATPNLARQESLLQGVEKCSCGYQDNRPNGRFCPSCGKVIDHYL